MRDTNMHILSRVVSLNLIGDQAWLSSGLLTLTVLS